MNVYDSLTTFPATFTTNNPRYISSANFDPINPITVNIKVKNINKIIPIVLKPLTSSTEQLEGIESIDVSGDSTDFQVLIGR